MSHQNNHGSSPVERSTMSPTRAYKPQDKRIRDLKSAARIPPSERHPYSQMVKVSVENKDGKVLDFIIHRTVICGASPYFNAMFKEVAFGKSQLTVDWDGQIETVQYEASHEAFKTLVDYAYTQHYCPNQKKPEDKHLPFRHLRKQFVDSLIELWVLAHGVEMTKLCHETMERLLPFKDEIGGLGDNSPTENHRYIYDNTIRGSPGREFIVQAGNAYFWNSKYIESSDVRKFLIITDRELICSMWLAMLDPSHTLREDFVWVVGMNDEL